MRRLWWSGATMLALTLVGQTAFAHELICVKTVNGENPLQVDTYPTTVTYRVTVTNVHPTSESVMTSASDSNMSVDVEVPMTLAIGESIVIEYPLTIESFEHCNELSRQFSPLHPSIINNTFTVGWELGSAMCMARIICGPPEQPPCEENCGPPGEEGGATRTMGFFKTHESALTQCLAEGSINLGYITISTLEAALGMLWGSPDRFDDGTSRTGLDKFRFLLARQTMVAICNTRLFGTETPLTAQAVAALSGTNCDAISSLIDDVDGFNNSGDEVAFPDGFNPGPATPRHASSIANDPTTPSGQSCQ